jgi:hypothetical protein
VVIAERGSDDRTVVLSRRDFGQLGKRRRFRPWLVWGMAGVFAFGAGGVLSSWLSAKRAAQPVSKPAPAPAARPAQPAAARGPDPSVRVVSVGDLPLEKRR